MSSMPHFKSDYHSFDKPTPKKIREGDRQNEKVIYKQPEFKKNNSDTIDSQSNYKSDSKTQDYLSPYTPSIQREQILKAIKGEGNQQEILQFFNQFNQKSTAKGERATIDINSYQKRSQMNNKKPNQNIMKDLENQLLNSAQLPLRLEIAFDQSKRNMNNQMGSQQSHFHKLDNAAFQQNRLSQVNYQSPEKLGYDRAKKLQDDRQGANYNFIIQQINRSSRVDENIKQDTNKFKEYVNVVNGHKTDSIITKPLDSKDLIDFINKNKNDPIQNFNQKRIIKTRSIHDSAAPKQEKSEIKIIVMSKTGQNHQNHQNFPNKDSMTIFKIDNQANELISLVKGQSRSSVNNNKFSTQSVQDYTHDYSQDEKDLINMQNILIQKQTLDQTIGLRLQPQSLVNQFQSPVKNNRNEELEVSPQPRQQSFQNKQQQFQLNIQAPKVESFNQLNGLYFTPITKPKVISASQKDKNFSINTVPREKNRNYIFDTQTAHLSHQTSLQSSAIAQLFGDQKSSVVDFNQYQDRTLSKKINEHRGTIHSGSLPVKKAINSIEIQWTEPKQRLPHRIEQNGVISINKNQSTSHQSSNMFSEVGKNLIESQRRNVEIPGRKSQLE